MTSTLWIFGDSFSKNHDIEWQWFKQLGYKEINNYSVSGASNDFIAHTLLQNLNRISSDDAVIIVKTEESREWFFNSRPDLGNYISLLDIENRTSKQEFQALKHYVQYLYNPHTVSARARAYESLFDEIVQDMDLGLVLPAWPSSKTSTACRGSLVEVCAKEFASEEIRIDYYNTQEDSRPNHLHQQNHTVLAQKIQDYWHTQKLIDLTQGFYTDLITEA